MHRNWKLPFIVTLLVMLACQPEDEGRAVLTVIASETSAPDVDQDGYSTQEGDCDDNDPSVHPGNIEGQYNAEQELQGDGLDNNCDGRIDEGTIDFDDDQDGFSERQGDCDDADGQRYPGRVDGCDSVDNDCDGETDEDARDAWEPNNSQEEAWSVGDVTCDYRVYEVNLDRTGDRDFFELEVCIDAEGNACGEDCDVGVAIQLQGIPDGLSFGLNLYRDTPGGPLIVGSIPNTVDSGDNLIDIDGFRSDGDPTVYFAEVFSAPEGRGISCQDEVRLVLFGLHPSDYTLPSADETK